MATQCHRQSGFHFQRKLTFDFSGGQLTTEAGLILVREFDEHYGLTASARTLLREERDRRYVDHGLGELLRQRVYQIVAGYEDANDATFLRDDPTMRSIVRSDTEQLASQPTLSRWENTVPWESIRMLETEGLQWFCRHQAKKLARAEEVILDIDSTCDPTHGQQAFSFFHGFYDTYMYHPLLVFDAKTGILLASRLRPGNLSGTKQLVPLLRALLPRLKHALRGQQIAIRADADFAKPDLLDFAEYAGCSYVIGVARHARLEAKIQALRKHVEDLCKSTGKPVRRFKSFSYQTKSWSRARRIVAKVECTHLGANVRFVVTNRHGKGADIFAWYERRGRAENFIKEFKNDLCADRLSCSSYRANAFRLQLHSLAYNLIVLFRSSILQGTPLANAMASSIRLKLFKLAARVRLSCRRLWFHLASGWPGQPLFIQVVHRLGKLAAVT